MLRRFLTYSVFFDIVLISQEGGILKYLFKYFKVIVIVIAMLLLTKVVIALMVSFLM